MSSTSGQLVSYELVPITGAIGERVGSGSFLYSICFVKARSKLGEAPTMSGLESYINHTVSIITADGRNFIGTLKGFDQTINIIIDECHERVFSTTSGIEQIVLGLHIIRGDNIAVIGLIDETIDSRLDLANIRGEPLGPVVH
ncbi:uncharacterized protein Dana_GF24963 [Drosophila ananassae]|nr:uncharacterized protein Dana_GF24963 [Drosophila ananassae]